VRLWEVVCDLVGRKILEIGKPVIFELAVVFVSIIWNRNQIEGFSLVEKFQNEDAMSELVPIFASCRHNVRELHSNEPDTGETRDGFHRVGVGMGLTGVMHRRIRSGDGSNERVIVP
jgi:hypothetical protein